MSLGLAAHIAFWVILLLGGDDLGLRRASVFVAAWIAGYFAPSWLPGGNFLFDSWVAVLDIVLLLLVFKGDVRVR